MFIHDQCFGAEWSDEFCCGADMAGVDFDAMSNQECDDFWATYAMM